MTEQAGRWVRVSTGAQNEADQIPSLDKWISEHNYEVAKTYTLHGKSASKGQQDKALDEVIRDMKNGIISVLVVFQSSRIERRGAYNAFDLARRVKEAGGRIEYSQDTHLNATNEMSDVALAMNATMDKIKSQTLSDAVKKSHAVRRAANALTSRTPFGYEPYTREDGYKGIRPTDLGREYVPQIFARIISGDSLTKVARWLNLCDVPQNSKFNSGWSDKSIAQLIRNPTYRGMPKSQNKQTRKYYGPKLMDCEPLIDADSFQKADERLLNAPVTRRPPSGNPPALLTSILFCGECNAPMYRSKSKYRCHGHNPNPVGCGFTADMTDLDQQAEELISFATKPMTVRKLVQEPKTYDQQRAEIQEQIDNIPLRRLGREETMSEMNRLYDALENIPGNIEAKWDEVPTGESVGEHYANLPDADKRIWLKDNIMFTAKTVTVDERGAIVDEGTETKIVLVWTTSLEFGWR